MRLIDADKLIEIIIKDCSGFQSQGYHTCKYDIVDIINQCDTDYDVDKVVEQVCKECLHKKECSHDYEDYDCQLIEIIKASGMYETTQEIDTDFDEHHFYAE